MAMYQEKHIENETRKREHEQDLHLLQLEKEELEKFYFERENEWKRKENLQYEKSERRKDYQSSELESQANRFYFSLMTYSYSFPFQITNRKSNSVEICFNFGIYTPISQYTTEFFSYKD